MLAIPVVVVVYMVGGYFLILAPGNLYNALVEEDWALFRSDILSYALIITAVLSAKVVRGVLRESSSNLLRARLARALHSMYIGKGDVELGYTPAPYYRLANGHLVDNPDQRVVADVRQFSSSLFDITAGGSFLGSDSGGLIEAAASLVWYSLKTAQRTGWYGLLVAYLWSGIVSGATVHAINRTSPAVFKQEQLEAELRFGHVELRRRAEEVAFLRGGPFERRKLNAALDRAVSNAWVVIRRHVYLNLVQYGFGYYVSLIMYGAIAFAIYTKVFGASASSFTSDMKPGEKAKWISQTGGIFIQLLFSFTMVIQLGTAVSSFVTSTTRVSTFIEDLEHNTLPRSVRESSVDSSDSEPLIRRRRGASRSERPVFGPVSHGLAVEDLSLQVGPSVSIGPLSFSLQPGQWLLLDGPSGSGKTSILRAMRGLWQLESGVMHLPEEQSEVLFMPQVPYISAGSCTLRDLILYPDQSIGSAEEGRRAEAALEAVGWRRGVVADVLDVPENWSQRLSPGEAQLIAAARVVAKRPAFAVLDEPTSSLDAASERAVFAALRGAGVSGLTVGHSPALQTVHDSVISLRHA